MMAKQDPSDQNPTSMHPTNRPPEAGSEAATTDDAEQFASLPREVREFLSGAGVSREQPGNLLEVLKIAHSHIGPIPPPSYLEGYDRTVPGSAEIIIDVYKSQSDHRRSLEAVRVHGSERRQNRGQYFAFGLAAFGLVAGLLIALFRAEIWYAGVALAFAGVGIPGVATVMRGWLAKGN